jgi:lipopolysaccharide export system protein LptC
MQQIPPYFLDKNFNSISMAATNFSPRYTNNQIYYFDKNNKLQLSSNGITKVLASHSKVQKYSQSEIKNMNTPVKHHLLDHTGSF